MNPKTGPQRLRHLLDENAALRRQLRAGEGRRRAAVDEIRFLNRRLTLARDQLQRLLALHRATVLTLAQTCGRPLGPDAWSLTFPQARPDLLPAHAMEAAPNPDGTITVTVRPAPPDPPEGGPRP